MSGFSLMQTRDFIDKLGDLDEEITRVCRTGEAVAKKAPKSHGDEVSRLQTAMESAQSCQEHVRCAKEALLRFDGFLHAVRPSVRQALMHPDSGGPAARFFDGVGRKAGPALEHHVGGLAEEGVEAIGRVKASLKALRVAEEADERRDDAKLSCKALEKVLSAAERTIEKAIKAAEGGSFPPRHEDRVEEVEEVEEAPVEEVEEVEVLEGKTAGYDLTAGGLPDFIKKKQEEREGEKDDDDDEKEAGKKAALPPEFLENAQKKKDEAKGKKDDDAEDDAKTDKKAHGYNLTAGELPDFIKKKQEEREDEKDDDDKSDKKAGKMPPQFAENAQKKKDEAAGKKEDDDTDEEAGKKAAALRRADSKDPDPSMDDDLPGEDTDGEPVVDKSAHGYQLTDPSQHGYRLTA